MKHHSLRATPHFVSSSSSLLLTTTTTHNLFSLAPISFPLHQNPINNKSPTTTVRYSFKYNFDDDEEVFEGAKRNWWSDSDYDDDTDFEFGEEEDDDFFWVFKILRAFGWMLPAIAISLLLGTGPNAFIMALAVPLGQSALSFVNKKASSWGSTRNPRSKKPKTKTKKKPFSRAARKNTREDDGESWVNGVGSNSYVNGSSYGGWDELEKRVRATNQKTTNNNNRISKLQHKDRSYSSRLGRVRDTPLFLRLLIAVFPYLGSWTKLFL